MSHDFKLMKMAENLYLFMAVPNFQEANGVKVPKRSYFVAKLCKQQKKRKKIFSNEL